MNIKTLALVVTSALAITATSAMAADGKINFTGAITDNACTVTNNMANPLTVALGTVASSAFTASGDTASPTKFTIVLTKCPTTFTSATVKFDGTSDEANNALLSLTKDSGVATGVAIEISDINNNPIPLHTPSSPFTLVEGNNNLEFVARYFATAAKVTEGSANASSNFTIAYN